MGPALPQYTTGARSSWLPPALRDKVAAVAADPELIGLREHLAVLDIRLGDLLDRALAGSGGGKDTWAALVEAFGAFEAALATGRVAEMKAAIPRLRAAVETGREDHNLWAEIRATIDTRRKASDAERRRLVDLQHLITADEALGIGRSLVDLVREHVKDPDALSSIVAGFARLMGRPDPRGTARPR